VGTTVGGSASNVMTVADGAYFDMYQINNPIEWSLVMENNARLYSRSGNNLTQNIWAGPVTLNGAATLDGAGSTLYTISGDITGTGSIRKTGDATLYLRSTNSTYTGTTTVNQGTLWAYNPGSLPGYDTASNLSVAANATLTVRAGDGETGFDKDQITTVLTQTTFSNNTARLGIDTALTNLVLNSNIAGNLSLSKYSTGSLTLAGTNTYTGTTRVYGGELILSSSSSNWLNRIEVLGGTAGATLRINGDTTTKAAGNNSLAIGIGGGDRSSTYISANLLAYDLISGNASAASGAILQNSGLATARYIGIGAATGGYGYYRVNGGTANATDYFEVGNYGDGVMEVYGGTVAPNNTFDINRRVNGKGLLNVFNGLVNAPSNGNQMQMGRDFDAPEATLNVFGPGVVNAAAGTGTTKIFNMNAGGADNMGICSISLIDGGTLIANKIGATRSGDQRINFDGGTLKANSATTAGATFLQDRTAATVYSGGATIDSGSAAIRINQALLAPRDLGVTSIAVANSGAGYIGAPIVWITGGSSTGATAIATVDLTEGSPTQGKLTGFTITSPGSGYQPGDVLAVALIGGGPTTAATAGTVALGANTAEGGLTKIGTGTLTLGGTNTYGGLTTISEGILALGIPNALPADADINLTGGIYTLGGFTVTNGTVTVTSGAIINGSLVCDSLSKSDSGTLNLGAELHSETPVTVDGGTLKLLGTVPGLYEGFVAGAFELNTPNPNTAIELTTRASNGSWGNSGASGGIWTDNRTYIYTGFIWNRATTNVTWTFAENFDDKVRLVIGTTTVIADGAAWNEPTIGTISLAPGPHAFEVRLGQGGGGVGAVNSSWWTTTAFGFGVDFQGRNTGNISYFQPLADPGDGSLLSLTSGSGANVLAAGSTVEMAAGTVLNLGGTTQELDTLSGAGTVSNGTLAVTTTLAPGGVNLIGTLSIGAALTLNGELLIDVAADGSSDLLAVTGDLDLSAGTLTIANPAQLDSSKQYTIATCSGTLTQPFAVVTIDGNDSHWKVKYTADGTVKLIYQGGTMIILR